MDKTAILKRTALPLTAAVGFVFAALQFVPVYAHANPPVAQEKTIAASLDLPPQVQTIVRKACMDCHSNETRWPWYSKLAPMSWLVARDVERARKAMNLSEWSDTLGRKKGKAAGALLAACEGVKAKRMPLPQYQMMHPEARLSQDEINTFCAWTAAAVHQLKSSHGVTDPSAR